MSRKKEQPGMNKNKKYINKHFKYHLHTNVIHFIWTVDKFSLLILTLLLSTYYDQ